MRMTQPFSRLFGSLMLLAAVAACNSGRATTDTPDGSRNAADSAARYAADLPKGPPSLRGTITSVQPARTAPSRNMIRVEERPNQSSGDAKAVVSVSSTTVIYEREGTALVRIPFERIQTGWSADVWFEGPVAESYPVQATAGALVVQPPL